MRIRLLIMAAVALATIGTATGMAAGSPVAASPASAAAGPCGTAATPHSYQHVVWIWMENHSFSDIIGNKAQAPYLNSLAARCGLATNYHNTSHPSLPNYLSATSGLAEAHLPPLSFFDCNVSSVCDTSAPSIFGQGETWKAYQESMPSSCDRSNSGEYAVRHNPPPYYTSLSGCAKHDVPYPQLATDLARNDLPAFSFITPNLLDDMHTGTIAEGDRWMAANLPKILGSDEYADGSTAVFITWDEGHGGTPGEKCATNKTDDSCHIATIVISPSTKPGTRSATLFSHYSLLRTAEELLGLPLLGHAAGAASMVSAFHL
jgi:phosphatidylinositol-3-phosphatase